MLSNRLSWFYNLRGPSLTVETACSSSLVACHLAAQSLDNHESSMALVTGCNFLHSPETTIQLGNLGVLSPNSKSYSFDDKADGYARGEGVAVAVLKRISDAVRDGDTIRAVIRNIGCNQDGKSPGVTVPTAEAQAALMRRLYTEAGLDLGLTRYFEAHATGTAVGDPIELSAIAEVFSSHMSAEHPMYVGSVKTNVGHLEGVAGLAGLLKAVYVLENGTIPAHLWFDKWNSQVDIDTSLFKIPTTSVPWPGSMTPRRVSVNSFGIGGTNAHVILDDARSYLQSHELVGHHATHTESRALGEDTASQDSSLSSWEDVATLERPRLFLLSAFDENGVGRLADAYLQYLQAQPNNTHGPAHNPENFLDNLSYTLAAKRSRFVWRASVVAESSDSLIQALSSLEKPVRSTMNRRLGLVFTGQGAQWPGMGRELHKYKVFRDSVGAASRYLESLGCSWSLWDLLFDANSANLDMDAPGCSQLVCTVLQVALVELLQSWSLEAHAVIGHSSGEIAAAFAAGAISRESAWRIAYYRGVLAEKLAGTGIMMAVGVGADDAKIYVDQTNANGSGTVAIACINSPKNVTVSGAREAIDRLAAMLTISGIFGRKLRVTNAYHSSYMAPVANEYAKLVGKIDPGMRTATQQGQSPPPKFFSSLLGREAAMEALLQADYWVQNLLCPVEFNKGLQSLLAAPVPGALTTKNPFVDDLVEIGPHAALRTPIRDILTVASNAASDVGYASVLFRGSGADRTVLETAGWLFSRGHQVDMAGVVLGGAPLSAPSAAPEMLTDLPGYAFDHSKSYWNETRLSKSYRFRQFPRHDLLGAPVPDWNPSNAVWGHYLRVRENPWVKDHVVAGSTLYPAAGMLVMAIEAMKQLADPVVPLAGFKFKDVSFHLAISVPDDLEGLETRFYLRPLWEGTASQSATWNEFELWSFQKGEWRNHCRGWVQAVPVAAPTVVDGGLEQRLFDEACANKVAEAERTCLDPLTHDQVYEAFEQVGIHYGLTFQNLSDVHIGSLPVAVATLTAPDLGAIMPCDGYTHPHIIHPATLDSALSAAFTALHRGGAEGGHLTAAVPTKVKEMWIAATADDNGSTAPLRSIRLAAHAQDRGGRKFTANLVGVHLHSRKPLLTIQGLESTAIVNGGSSAAAATAATAQADMAKCYNVDWRPDATLWRRQEDSATVLRALAIPDALLPTKQDAIDRADTFTLGCAYLKKYLADASEPFGKLDPTRPHYQKYLQWVQGVLARLEQRTSSRPWGRFSSADEVITALEAPLEQAGPNSKIIVECGKALNEFLTGERDPLQLLFTDKLAENTYIRPYPLTVIANYMRMLAHKNPQMNILEVGAGTGATTGFVLEALGGQGEHVQRGGKPLFGKYVFTDLSPAFFEPAQDKFNEYVHKMQFTVFNAEHDPETQDLEAGQYDVVIAANVVHATQSIHETLSNMRRLLKPGGKLVLFELTDMDTNANFAFGLLPGWWLSKEEDRQAGPLLSPDKWDARLRASGYSGVDLIFGDGFEVPDVSVMIGTAVCPGVNQLEEKERQEEETPPLLVITDGPYAEQERLARQLEKYLSASVPNAVVTTITLDRVRAANEVVKGKVLVFLPEISRSVLAQPDKETFEAIKAMCESARAILWVVAGGGTEPADPNTDLVLGFARNMRLESPVRMVTLGLSAKSLASSRAADLIVSFVQDKLLSQDTGPIVDNDFREVDDLLMIPRLVPASGLFGGQRSDSSRKIESGPALVSLGDGGGEGSPQERALRLEVQTLGLLDSLCFVDDELYGQPLGDGDVEFRIMAAGLNFKNVLYALGQLPAYAQYGSEAAGIVTRVGRNTPFQIGDKVFGINNRTIATFARSHHKCLAPIPDHLSFAEAAAIPVAFMTAYMALYDYARIKQGETVLIHSATGGLGQACIQLAQLAGAEVFATVGSLEKCAMLTETYGIPRDHIFSSRDLSFAAGIMRMTGGKGVHVIVNSLSGAALRASWDCIAAWGRFAECGKKDVLGAATLPMEMFTKNVSFRMIDLEVVEVSPERIEAIGQMWSSVHRLLTPRTNFGLIRPLHVFPYSQLTEAHQYMQSGTHIGKIILEPRPDDTVLVSNLTPSSSLKFCTSVQM